MVGEDDDLPVDFWAVGCCAGDCVFGAEVEVLIIWAFLLSFFFF